MTDRPVQPALTFSGFVLSLASTAAIHFGDLPDPATGARSEPNLEGAAQMIEILALLEVKTRGNLSAEERQILEQVLYELRLRFVDASSARRNQASPAMPNEGGKRIIDPTEGR